MLTKNEINSLSLSPTNKDFVQIWNELLEVAGKLSERWDPTSTNESDPGIVLLKALTGIADKLNYNIDKNTLEAFMPTAAQEDSMRKLCDMLGYNIKYYQSAVTDVTIKYYNSDPSDEEASQMAKGLLIPKFTVITNSDQDISYFTINENSYYIYASDPSIKISCMEGQIVKCESANDNNVITANQITENNRFYLPETYIAENGIFIYNIQEDNLFSNGALVDGAKWNKVDNLNILTRGTRAFKFGFDSYEGRPYIEFPEDYSELFNNGIFIYYTRTNGINGNVSPGTLTQLVIPSSDGWENISAESFSATNVFSANNGANIETIEQAYNNFKRTIGTFETLVTCRDYMNKIYSMVNDAGNPYVSNILVTDIRNDLNRAVTICSCDDAGIFYKETAIIEQIPNDITKPVYNANSNDEESKWHLGTLDGLKLTNFIISNQESFNSLSSGTVRNRDGYWEITQDGTSFRTNLPVHSTSEAAIDHFDIVFYPFKTYSQIKTNVKSIRDVYDSSFIYTTNRLKEIELSLDADEIKTIAHNIITPRQGDIVSINNYLKLNAAIATNSKITIEEGTLIVENVKKALANAFNMRQLDFGEEIPFDSIVSVIEKADTRIKVVSLNEPTLYTTFSVIEDSTSNPPKVVEYAVASSDWLTQESADTTGRFVDSDGVTTFNTDEAKKIYNRLAVRNILAGRIPLFKYNNVFKTSFSESAYQITDEIDISEVISALPKPDDKTPFTILVGEDGVTYTGRYINEESTVYSKTYTPDEYKDNIVTEVSNNDITDISTECVIAPVEDKGNIKDVTLKTGEFVKFRAPNFTTIKTYPAYVNYHLKLNSALNSESRAAEAISLFEVLNSDVASWSENTTVKWQKVLNYFNEHNSTCVKTFSLTQKVSKRNNTSDTQTTGSVSLIINNDNQTSSNKLSAEEFLARSGCIKLLSNEATITWDASDGDIAPSGPVTTSDGKEIKIELFKNDAGQALNPFIVQSEVLTQIKEAVNECLANNTNNLPTECSWTVSFDFECVPFEAESLLTWENLLKECLKNYDNNTYKFQVLRGEVATGSGSSNTLVEIFKPDVEDNTILWRKYGDGYDTGKYVTASTEKLLKFTKNYFGLISETRLAAVYLVKLGQDAIPKDIKNSGEYALQTGERLFIEYTPSSTTEDGTSQNLPAVTEIYREGTIIRPNGFEDALVDSSVYASQGNSANKTVTFETSTSTTEKIPMYHLGANEQIEIRDYSRVILDRSSFNSGANGTSSSSIYYYKNFNGCTELEELSDDRSDRTYTLKDGEYIFYTDKNKSEFAYFTSGTQVTLTGGLVLVPCDIIDIATILDSGPQEIPWKSLSFSTVNDTIIFQEYQYITLGSGDTIENLELTPSGSSLTSEWKDVALNYSDNIPLAQYRVAGSEESQYLPSINVDGYGWSAASFLELDVSSDSAQMLRNTDCVMTTVSLGNTSLGGENSKTLGLTPKSGTEISFKTNLTCQAVGSEVNINDIYLNPDKAKGFKLKFFRVDEPTIVRTEPAKVVPYRSDNVIDINNWPGTPLSSLYTKSSTDFWNQVNLDKIKPGDSLLYDSALRLSPSLLPDTYGIFSIYLNYTSDSSLVNASTWIELVPGADIEKDVAIFNTNIVNKQKAEVGTNNSDKIFLSPGLNCIRINKTGRLFIKTSSESQGTLYFDELRLVDCTPVKYTLNGNSIEESTQGLNLEQLGYLATSETLDNLLDEDSKAKRKENFTEIVLEESDIVAQEAEIKISEKMTEFAKYTPKIQLLVEAEKNIRDDMQNIAQSISINNSDSEDNKDAIIKLISTYKQIQEELQQEETLYNSLVSDKNLDNLDQLVNLLESSVTVEDYKQVLLAELEDLVARVTEDIERIEQFTENVIIDDFKEECEKESTWKNTILQEVVQVAQEKVDKNYFEQITRLADDVNQVVNYEDRSLLMSALNLILSAETAGYREQIQTLVNQLVSAVDRDTLDSVLAGMAEAAALPDYTNLTSLLVQLKTIMGAKDLKTYVAEIERAFNENTDSQLKNLITELKEILEDTDSSTDGILESISTLEESVKTELAKTEQTVSSSIVSSINSLINDVSEAYTGQLKALAEDILAKLGEIEKNTTYTTILEGLNKLEDSQEAQVLATIDKVKKLTTTYSTQKEVLTDSKFTLDSWENSIVSSYVREALIIVWPKYMKQRLNIFVNVVTDEIIKDAINKTTIATNFAAYRAEITNYIKRYLTDTLEQIIDINAFFTTFDKIEPMFNEYTQKSAYVNLISTIESNTIASSETKNAMIALSSLEDTAATRNTLSIKLLNVLTGTEDISVIKKHQLIASLQDELSKSIQLNKQLLKIVANYVCPSVLLYSIDSSDTFYDNLTKKVLGSAENVSGVQNTLLNVGSNWAAWANTVGSDAAEFVTYCQSDAKLLDSLEDIDTFKTFIEEFSLKDVSTLFPTFIKDDIRELKTLITAQSEVKKINEAQLSGLTGAQLSGLANSLVTDKLKDIIGALIINIESLNEMLVEDEFRNALITLKSEEQLLAEIRSVDVNRDFYYNVPIETSLAIEFNESDSRLNTLMNPLTNYDINNVNNNFVISKLDIDYLTDGIRLARSSRLN